MDRQELNRILSSVVDETPASQKPRPTQNTVKPSAKVAQIVDESEEFDFLPEIDDSSSTITPALGTSTLDKVLIEVFATFLVCFVTIFVSVIFPVVIDTLMPIILPLSVGGIYALCYHVFGAKTGGGFNPAVSLAFAIRKIISWKDAGIFMCAQFVGGILAGGLVRIILLSSIQTDTDGFVQLIMNSFAANGYGTDTPSAHYATQTGSSTMPLNLGLNGAILFELIAIVIIASTLLSVNQHENSTSKSAGTVGIAYAIGVLLTYFASGSALNPARALGAALFSQNWGTDDFAMSQVGIFILIPMLGAAIVALISLAFVDSYSENYDADLPAHSDSNDWD
jgi:aquaporin Z